MRRLRLAIQDGVTEGRVRFRRKLLLFAWQWKFGPTKKKKNKKKRGRKAQRHGRHVVDMVNCSNDNNARKLVFIMGTGSVVTGTQPPASPSFNNFLQNKIKSLRWVSWSAIFIGSYVIFVTFFRWPTYTAVTIQRIKFGRNSTSESAVEFLPH